MVRAASVTSNDEGVPRFFQLYNMLTLDWNFWDPVYFFFPSFSPLCYGNQFFQHHNVSRTLGRELRVQMDPSNNNVGLCHFLYNE